MKRLALIPTVIAAFTLGASSAVAKDEKKELKPEVTVVIEGNDQMKFNKAEFKVKTGQVVKLTLKNVGKLPKVAMGHNLVILKEGTPVPQFAIAAMQAKDNDYIPKDQKDKIVAHTKILGPGESHDVIFKAPAPGKYDYICSFPGHFSIMKGQMIVE